MFLLKFNLFYIFFSINGLKAWYLNVIKKHLQINYFLYIKFMNIIYKNKIFL